MNALSPNMSDGIGIANLPNQVCTPYTTQHADHSH
jgi:hypothetical protein